MLKNPVCFTKFTSDPDPAKQITILLQSIIEIAGLKSTTVHKTHSLNKLLQKRTQNSIFFAQNNYEEEFRPHPSRRYRV